MSYGFDGGGFGDDFDPHGGNAFGSAVSPSLYGGVASLSLDSQPQQQSPTIQQQLPTQSPQRSSSPVKPKGRAPFADNPSQGLVPLPTTELCLRRLTGWARIVSKVVRYFEAVAEQERKLADSLSRQAREIDSDSSASSDLSVFRQDETVQTLLRDIAKAQARSAKDRISAANLIEEQLLPILKELFVEIRRKTTDTEKEWAVIDKEMKTDLEIYVRLAAGVRTSLMRQQWRDESAAASGTGNSGSASASGSADAVRDPWLADLALRKHIDRCARKQEHYRSKLAQQQDVFAAFEKVVVQNIRVALSTFYESRTSNSSRQLEQLREMKSKLESMSADSDWSLFKAEYCDRFIDEGVPLVQPSDLTYDGFDDPAVKTVRQGTLAKKEGVFKRSYRPVYIVLSASGYLHVFPPAASDEELVETPELSLDLAECNLTPLLSNEKEPEEIAIVEKSGGMFGRDSKHKFKGKNMAESAEWWGAINEQIRAIAKRATTAGGSVSSSPEKSQNPVRKSSLPSSTSVASADASVNRLSKRLQDVASKSTNSGAIPPLPPPRNSNNQNSDPAKRLSKSENLLDGSIEDLPQLASVLPPSPRTSVSNFATFPPPPQTTPSGTSGAPKTATGSPAVAAFASFPRQETNAASMPSTDENPINSFGLDSEKSKLPLSLQMEMALQSAVTTKRGATNDALGASGIPTSTVMTSSTAAATGSTLDPWASYEAESGGW